MAVTQLQTFQVACRLGTVEVAVSAAGVTALALPRPTPGRLQDLIAQRFPGAELTTVAAADHPAGRALLAYLAGEDLSLEHPVDLAGLGGEFRRRVLQALAAVPPGETTTYGSLAAAAGNPRAARAVGQVMHNNPVPLFLPCHRVVGKSGSLTGFGGGLEAKRALLDLEAGRLASLM
ncbi:MAG: methylated-DNA--[protein]-cysteine S-methyltransferase [Deltaproteobacteria bacterium]|nr:methylated-DNA--[protein]-cysteine S-methyltransferase [Deltaproteobacteria bacterium]